MIEQKNRLSLLMWLADIGPQINKPENPMGKDIYRSGVNRDEKFKKIAQMTFMNNSRAKQKGRR